LPRIRSTTSSSRHHVDHPAVAVLPDRHDPVRLAQLALLGGRPRRHQARDLGELVVLLQHRADAFERQAHVHVEILGAARREVVGVRVEQLGERVHVELVHVLAVDLRHAPLLVLVALGEQFLDGAHLLARELQPQHAGLELLAPKVVCRLLVGRPVELVTIGQQHFVLAEVHRLDRRVQLPGHALEARDQAFAVALVDREAGTDVPGQQLVVELVAELAELLDVGAQEHVAARIEVVEVAVEQPFAQGVVDLDAGIMVPAEAFDDVEGGQALGAVVAERRVRGPGLQQPGAEQRQQQDGTNDERGAWSAGLLHKGSANGLGSNDFGSIITHNQNAIHGHRRSGICEFWVPRLQTGGIGGCAWD
jgi:hypothetical protein